MTDRHNPPPTPPLFRAGDELEHRKGGRYVIVATPEQCRIEASAEPAYAYLAKADGLLWVRSQREMEDGRFIRIAAGRPQTGDWYRQALSQLGI